VVNRGALSLASVLAAALAAAACGGSPAAPQGASAGKMPGPASPPQPSSRSEAIPDRGPGESGSVAATRKAGATAILRIASHLFVEKDVSVLTRRAGVVSRIHVRRGARVKEGQLLCDLESRDLQLALEVARLEADRARAAFDRARRLDTESAISQESYENAQFALRGAERAVDIAAHDLEKASVRAPFDGVVSGRNVEVGQVLAEEDVRVLFRITALQPLLARVYIPSWAGIFITEGQSATIKPDTAPASAVEGRVAWINDILDAASASVEILVEAPPTSRSLFRPGLAVMVELRVSLPPGPVTLPRAALRTGASGPGEGEVTVSEAGVARSRLVRVGFLGDDRVEILEGLEADELVVLPK